MSLPDSVASSLILLQAWLALVSKVIRLAFSFLWQLVGNSKRLDHLIAMDE